MVGFPEHKPVWLEHGEPGREWQEVRSERRREPELVVPHRSWQSLNFIQSPKRLVSKNEGWSVKMKVKLGNDCVKRDPSLARLLWLTG